MLLKKVGHYMRILIMILTCTITFGGCTITQNDKVYMMVDDTPILYQELNFYIDSFKGEIINQIQGEYHTEYNDDFWKTMIDGQSHKQRFEQILMEKIKYIKATESLLKENGILPFDNFKQFLNNFNQENEQRQHALLNNEVIYGPEQYSMRDYYNYIIANSILSYHKNNEVEVTDEQLKIFEQENKDIIYQEEDTVSVDILYRPYVIDGYLSHEEMKKSFNVLLEVNKALKEGKTIEQILLDQDVSYMTYEFTPQNKHKDINQYTSLYYEAYSLEVGAYSDVISALGAMNIVIVTDRTSNNKRDFQEYKETLRIKYLEQYFQRLVQEKASQITVEIINNIDI